MARFRIPEHDLLHAEELLRNGALLKDAAATIGCNTDHLGVKLRERGVTIPRWRGGQRRLDLPADEIIARYNAGESCKSIAANLGCTRPPIVRLLREHGVTVRGGGAANRLRFADASADQLRAITAAARAKRMQNLSAHAVAGDIAAIGEGEREFFAALQAAGFEPVQQLIVDGYALDIACGKVAIEVKFSAGNRLCRRREREVHLIKSGWRIVYVVLTDGWSAARDNFIAALEFSCRLPPAAGKYRVIRRSPENAPNEVDINDYA